MLLPDGAGGGASRVGHRDQLGHEGGATRFVATCAFGKWHYSCGEGGHTDLQFLQRCNFLRDLYGATFFPYEARCNLASPASRKPRQEGRDSADKVYTIVAPRVGPVGDHNFHGATGGTFSVHVCTLRGCSD